jgi:hypothetical protein
MNNAGLAFDSTYTRHFPVWFELYESLDRDAGAAVALFRRVLATGPQSATDLINATRALQDRTSAANAGMREFPDQ